VLVGGQAVAFWADYYAPRDEALSHLAPMASKDIDFCGDLRAARACATRLAGRALAPTIDDVTPSTAAVVFVDDNGAERTIDFIDQPYGLDGREVYRLALPIRLLDDAGRPTEQAFRVMHPVLVLESRVHNCMSLPGYQTPHAIDQLCASVPCAREFVRDVIGTGRTREALVLFERIFRFCLRDLDGRAVHAKLGVDPFDAVQPDERLPERFRSHLFPQMRRLLAARRKA